MKDAENMLRIMKESLYWIEAMVNGKEVQLFHCGEWITCVSAMDIWDRPLESLENLRIKPETQVVYVPICKISKNAMCKYPETARAASDGQGAIRIIYEDGRVASVLLVNDEDDQ